MGFVLAGGAQFIIGMMMLPEGVSTEKMADEMLKAMMLPKNVGLARLSQVLGTFLLLFLPAVLYSLVVNGRNSFWLGFSKYFNANQVIIGFFIILVANMLASPLADLSKMAISHFPSVAAFATKLENTYNEQVAALSNLKSWGEMIIAIFIMAFFPAVFEELFFRGAMQNLFVKWWKKPLLAVIFTSLIFSLIHFSIYLFLSRAVLGFALGYMFYQTKNIWVNIWAHFLNNAIAVGQLFYMSRKHLKIDVNEMDPGLPLWTGIITAVILFFLFKLMEKYSAENKARIVAREQVLIAQEDPFHSFAEKLNP
jgi:hypothetical protein